MLNKTPGEILASLTDIAGIIDINERHLTSTLFEAIGAALDRQATYHAAAVYRETRLDPRSIDPLLVRLAEHDLLLYRAYSRGVTLKVGEELSDKTNLNAIEQRFAGSI